MGHAPYVQCSVRFSGPTTHPQAPYVICLWSLTYKPANLCGVGSRWCIWPYLGTKFSYRADFFVSGWVKIPDWNSEIGWCSFSQPGNKSGKQPPSSNFLAFKSAYLLVLHRFYGQCDLLIFFPTLFFFFPFPQKWLRKTFSFRPKVDWNSVIGWFWTRFDSARTKWVSFVRDFTIVPLPGSWLIHL